MPLRISFAPEAVQDLDSLFRFIVQRTSDPVTAFRYIQRLRTACERLATFPERGTRRDDFRSGLRTIGFERRATIVFKMGQDEVRIIRIAYGGRDLTLP